jgi:hypothetical protein
MKVYRNRVVLQISKSLGAFLDLEAGLTRGEPPERTREISRLERSVSEREREVERQSRQLELVRARLARQDAELAEVRRQLTEGEREKPVPQVASSGARERIGEGGVSPEKIVWIFGTARVGSTWLAAMMGELGNCGIWHEPLVGNLFGTMYYFRAGKGHRDARHFVLGRDKRIWKNSIRAFVLSDVRDRFPELGGGDYLIVKEPNGSIGAPLLVQALPESRMIFLVRDPRDVVASGLDASSKGSWFEQRQSGTRKAVLQAGPDANVERVARKYRDYVGRSKEAYELHRGPKVLVRYEELVADTPGTMRRIYTTLGMPFDENVLQRTVEKHSWENIPSEKKGSGKFYRKGSPGSWREDLSPKQVEIVEEINASLLEEFYPS